MSQIYETLSMSQKVIVYAEIQRIVSLGGDEFVEYESGEVKDFNRDDKVDFRRSIFENRFKIDTYN